MLIWTITQQDKKDKFLHSYQAYNIKGIGTLLEFSEETLLALSTSDHDDYYFIESVEELDDNTLLPIFINNNALISKYPMVPILQDYCRLFRSSWNFSFVRALVIAMQLKNPMPSKKPKKIPYIFVNDVGILHAPTGGLLRIIDNMLYAGFPQESVELFLTTVVSKETIFHPKAVEIIQKVLEIAELLWRNHYVTKH